MDPVVHFEMPAQDQKRMAEFYEKVFDWKIKELGNDMNNYMIAQTTETDNNGMAKSVGAINGGFYAKTSDMNEAHPHIVISVKDIKKSMLMVKKSGGKTLGEPMEIPGVGLYVIFIDTEGNRVCMLQPKG